jgi:hypothetical protein
LRSFLENEKEGLWEPAHAFELFVIEFPIDTAEECSSQSWRSLADL